MLIKIKLLIIGLLCTTAFDQGRYELTNLTRDTDGEYRANIGGTEVKIKAQYCYEYVYGANGFLVWNFGGYGSKLVIVDRFDREKRTTCDVSEVWIKQR